MKANLLTTGLLTAALAIAPLTPASAHDWHHHGGIGAGPLIGIGAAVGAVALGAAMLATAPVRILADAAQPGPVYAEPSYPGDVAMAPAPVYAQAPAYAAPAPVYASAPVYAAPAPVMYATPVPVYAAYVRHPHYAYAPAYGYAVYR